MDMDPVLNGVNSAETSCGLWPEQQVVARMMGSLPMGGAVPETPIHAFARTPAALSFQA